jgi:hypothetical protein
MSHRTAVLFALSFVAVAAPLAAGHTDWVPTLTRSDKEYAAPKPLGSIRVVYTAPAKGAKASLLIKSDLFEITVPAEGLTDLPRADWERTRSAKSRSPGRSARRR